MFTAIKYCDILQYFIAVNIVANSSEECTSFLCTKLLVINVIILIKSHFISSNVYALDSFL